MSVHLLRIKREYKSGSREPSKKVIAIIQEGDDEALGPGQWP